MRWLAKLKKKFKHYNALSHVDWQRAHAQAKVNVLKQSMQDALTFLRKNPTRKFLIKRKLPWHLLLGTENAGKTSLLALAEFGLTTIDNQPLHHVNPTAYCDWWFHKDTVFVDVAGNLILSEDPHNDSHFIWAKFVDFLRSHQRRHPVSAITVCIDLNDFQTKSRGQRQLLIDMFRHRIQILSQYMQQLPIYLVFTKCDQIPGFTDTFNGLSPEDCQQACGLVLPAGIWQQNLPQQLEEQFNGFLQRLNQQLIGKLHRERNLEKRINIKNFPLQLEAQKRDIITIATQLHSTNTHLMGVYFTSSVQSGKNADALADLSHNFGFPIVNNAQNAETAPQKKAFFIHQLLKDSIYHKPTPPKKWLTFLSGYSKQFYTILGGLVLAACLLIVPSYFYNKNTLHHLQTALYNYHAHPNAPGAALTQFLPLLNSLQNALAESDHYSYNFFTLIFNQADVMQGELKNTYSAALKLHFIPLLQRTLERQIQPTPTSNPQELMGALKVYLMLGNPNHLNRHFVKTWFAQYWQKTEKNPAKLHQLNAHLDFLLNQSVIPFKANPQLIKTARQALNSLPLSELAYLTLQENHATAIAGSAGGIVEFGLPLTELYNVSHFNAIYKQEIPKLAQRMITGDDWVLNRKLPENFTGPLQEQLINSVRHMYLQHYATYWQTQLLSIKINKFANLAQARDFVASLNSPQSPLFVLFSIVLDNLQPLANLPEVEPVMATEQQLQGLLLNTQKNKAEHLALINLANQLDTILKADNKGAAALEVAKQRMSKLGAGDAYTNLMDAAQSTPLPISGWLNTVALNSWGITLKTAQNYLNLVWMTDVLPKYREHIYNKYPIFNNAKTEMSIEEFTEFFGNGGTMDTYFKHYLSPFVNSSQLYWQWKSLDGESIDIPQSTLEMLDRAALIRHMYFRENQKKPSVKFSLTPTDVGLLSQNFQLDLNGQLINYLDNFRQAKSVNWSGTAKQETAAFVLLQRNNEKKIFWQETGPWALFKLLAHANLKHANSPQEYILSFDANGISVPYHLIADQPINPFIPNIVTSFRAPEKL